MAASQDKIEGSSVEVRAVEKSCEVGVTMTPPSEYSSCPPTPTASQFYTSAVDEAEYDPKGIGPPLAPESPTERWCSPHMSPGRETVFNLMICTMQLVPQACLTSCFPITEVLTRDFDITDPAILPWTVSTYAVSFSTTILLAGRLGDIFGHKATVGIGFAWLSIWSLLAGVSRYSSHEFFFVARAMQGLGSALMNPNALAMLGRAYVPGSTRQIIAFSAFGLCAPIGAYLGMLSAAIFGQLVHWSWCFYLWGIVSAALGVAGAFILPSAAKSTDQTSSLRGKAAQMDWLGGTIGVSGLICLQVAFTLAASQGWNTQYVYMLLVVGILLVGFFLIVELRVACQPLVPFRSLNSAAAFVLGTVASGWGTFGVWAFYLWRFLLRVLHDTPLQAALHVLPMVPVAVVAAGVTAILMRKVRPAWVLAGALLAFTVGSVLMSLNDLGSSYWTFTFLSLVITPFGMDMSFPAPTLILSNSLPVDSQGVAGSLVTTVVDYSISLSLGLASTVETRVIDHGHELLRAMRGAWIFASGLGGLGAAICVIFLVKTRHQGSSVSTITTKDRETILSHRVRTR